MFAEEKFAISVITESFAVLISYALFREEHFVYQKFANLLVW